MTGKELKRLRTQMKCTQKQLAQKVGVTGNTVARWERGEVPISEPVARLLRGGQMDETMADFYEREFPGSVGKRLAAFTRESEKLLARMDELTALINSTPLNSERSRELVRELLSISKQHEHIIKQMRHELNRQASVQAAR
jgi:transcriptional regulator with XRE-family HTH domain